MRTTIPIHLLLLRTSAIFCELPLTRGGCRNFRRGDGSERAIGRHDTSSNRLRFFAGLTIRIAYARICASAEVNDLRSASVALARERRAVDVRLLYATPVNSILAAATLEEIMRLTLLSSISALAAAAVAAVLPVAVEAQGADLVQTNLVSDIPGLAKITDPQLKNPWGVSHSPTSPFWVSNQGTSTATLYAVTDETNVAKVNINPPAGNVLIPTTAAGPQGPTGQVSNTNTNSFPVNKGGDGGSAHFIFANLNGTISAWDKGPTAFIQVTTPGAVYTGLAINGAQTRLYAANSVPPGHIDVFDNSFNP